MAEFVLNELGFVREVLYVATYQLAQTQMLIQCRTSLILALEDMPETGAQTDFTPPVEDNLRASQIRVRHVLLMQIVY